GLGALPGSGLRRRDLRNRRSVRAAFLPAEVVSVSLSPGSPLLVAATARDVFGFDLRSEKVVLKEPDRAAAGATDDINQVLMDEAGQSAAVADDSGAVRLLDLKTWCVEKTLAGKAGHENICSSLAWKPG
ncbi:unnamed protein product, partial [Effrenium voratum]